MPCSSVNILAENEAFSWCFLDGMAFAVCLVMIQQLTKNEMSTQRHYRVAAVDLPSLDFEMQVVDDVETLESLVAPWSRLIETAVRPNPFFDPDFLIPAMRYLADGNVQVLVVKSKPRVNPDGDAVICGLVPIQKKKIYGMPFSAVEFWKHDQCPDSTPLLRADVMKETLAFIFSWLAESMGVKLLSLDTVAGDGAFANLLTEEIHHSARTSFNRDRFTRACFKPMNDADEYINTNVGKSTRKGTLKSKRKLAERGLLETSVATAYEIDWIEQFMRLEASGWKGQQQTAFASNHVTNHFFREAAQRMLTSGKMTLMRITLSGQPIAMACDIHHEPLAAGCEHAVHFKIAFNESLRESSPGLILELENIERLHETNVQFVDSGAAPDHPMINRVWSDRVAYQSLIVALKPGLPNLAVAGMPIIQLLKNKIRSIRSK